MFVGQDFAFAGGQTHSAGATYSVTYDEQRLPDDYISVPGVGDIQSSRIVSTMAFLLHMQEYLLNYEYSIRTCGTSTFAEWRARSRHGLRALDEAIADVPRRDRGDTSIFANALTQRIPVPGVLRKKTMKRWRQARPRALGTRRSRGDDGLVPQDGSLSSGGLEL